MSATPEQMIGKTVASVQMHDMAGRDTFKDTVTWTLVEITFTDGTQVSFADSDGEVYDAFEYDGFDADGDPIPLNEKDENGLVGVQRERYAALVEHVGHDAALADARTWPVVEEDPHDDDGNRVTPEYYMSIDLSDSKGVICGGCGITLHDIPDVEGFVHCPICDTDTQAT